MFRSRFADDDPRREMMAKAYARPAGDDMQDRAMYMELIVEFTSHDEAARLRRQWFKEAVDFCFRDLLDQLVENPPSPRGFRTGGREPWGPPGSMWGHTRTEIRSADGKSRSQSNAVSAKALHKLDERLSSPELVSAELYVGRLGKFGFLADSPQFMVASENVAELDGDHLRFVLMFDDGILYTLDGTMQTLALAQTFGNLCDPLFGTVDYTYGPTRYEDEHNLVYYDNFSLMRSRLRGFGWLTIIPKQVATALGGHDGLVHPTFARVEELAGGGFLLAATHRFNEYGDAARSRLEQFFAPVLVDRVEPTSRNNSSLN